MNKTIEAIKQGSLSVELDTNNAELVANNLKQMVNISQIIASTLKEKSDYGILPGVSDKYVLYQSGADKILLLFGLRPKFKIIEKLVIDNGYEITIECQLVKLNDESKVLYNAFGVASHKEGKGSKWPLDTLIKMAQKRAKVWATKSIGGLSDMFIDEEGEIAIAKSHLITTKQFNDLYKSLLNVILKEGINLEQAKQAHLKPRMLAKITEWNKTNKNVIGGLMDLPKIEYDNFLKFIGE